MGHLMVQSVYPSCFQVLKVFVLCKNHNVQIIEIPWALIDSLPGLSIQQNKSFVATVTFDVFLRRLFLKPLILTIPDIKLWSSRSKNFRIIVLLTFSDYVTFPAVDFSPNLSSLVYLFFKLLRFMLDKCISQ